MYSSYNYRYLDYTIFCTKPLRYIFYISYHISSFCIQYVHMYVSCEKETIHIPHLAHNIYFLTNAMS